MSENRATVRIPMRGTLACLATWLLFAVGPPPVRAASWERVKEFYGSVTIHYSIDHEADLDGQKHIRRKNASATIRVTGHTFDGAYSWPVGTITGTMSAETHMINTDGSAYSGSFSGSIDDSFDGEKHGGPGLEVNKELGLYQISLPHLYAKGTATATVPVLGTSTDRDAEDDAAPIIPERYRRKGVPYDPEAGFIDGGFTHSEEVPYFPKPLVVTMTASWHFDFELPPLRAEAGDMHSVERGETVVLDGSASTGRIEEYRWEFEPVDCPPDTELSHPEREGERIEIAVLCSLTATLTVSDGTDTDTDQTAIQVEPRDWETAFSEDSGELVMRDPMDAGVPWFDPRTPARYFGGVNVCAHEGSPQEYHNLHPRLTGDSWEGAGYTLELIQDPAGPFDGYWYVSEYDLEIRRAIAINPYLLEGDRGRPLPGYTTTFHGENTGGGMDVAGYLEAIRTHERQHSRYKRRALESRDPAKDVEGEFSRERDLLKDAVDFKLRTAERRICEESSDPLPDAEKRFDLLFRNRITTFHTKIEVCVGGRCEPKVPCPEFP